jgi:hypothetical protein
MEQVRGGQVHSIWRLKVEAQNPSQSSAGIGWGEAESSQPGAGMGLRSGKVKSIWLLAWVIGGRSNPDETGMGWRSPVLSWMRAGQSIMCWNGLEKADAVQLVLECVRGGRAK